MFLTNRKTAVAMMFVAAAAGAMLGAACAQQPAEKPPEKPITGTAPEVPADGDSKELQSKNWHINDKSGGKAISFGVMKNGGGLWIEDKSTGYMVAMYALPDQGAVMGFYDKKSQTDGTGMPFAFAMGKDGVYLQTHGKDKKVKHTNVADIVEATEHFLKEHKCKGH